MNAFHQTVARYREGSRHIRNTYFQPIDDGSNKWDVIEGWQEVDRMLFNWLVLYPNGLQPTERGHSHLQIGLRITGQGATTFINRDKFKDHGYWDHSITELSPNDCTLTFRKFFDFDQLSYMDFNYVMVEISNAKDADLNGRLALIEWQQVEFEKK